MTLQTCSSAATVPAAAAPNRAPTPPEPWCLVRGVGWVIASALDGSAALLTPDGKSSASALVRKLLENPADDPLTQLAKPGGNDDSADDPSPF